MLSIYTNNQLNPSLKRSIVIYSGSCTPGKGQILNNLRMVGYRTQVDIENLGSDLSPCSDLSISIPSPAGMLAATSYEMNPS